MKKRIVMAALIAALITGWISAQDAGDAAQEALMAQDGLTAQEAGDTADADAGGAGKKTCVGGTLGYGALNLALGIGSFIQGDIGGGVTIALSYGVAAGLIGWELSLAYEDDLAGVPGAIGLGVAGLTALYGFIRPALYARNRAFAEFMDGMSLAVAPVERGGAAVRLSYTLKF